MACLANASKQIPKYMAHNVFFTLVDGHYLQKPVYAWQLYVAKQVARTSARIRNTQ
jgi:hypothetical protein